MASLLLDTVTRHQAGGYTCTGDTGHQAVTKQVTISLSFKPTNLSFITQVRVHVEHPPEIHVDHSVVTVARGQQREIRCTVHGYPRPTVTWMKVLFLFMLAFLETKCGCGLIFRVLKVHVES